MNISSKWVFPFWKMLWYMMPFKSFLASAVKFPLLSRTYTNKRLKNERGGQTANSFIECFHRLSFLDFYYLDIRLHDLIVAVSCPCHDSWCRYTHRERIAYECTTPCVRSYKFALRVSFFNAFRSFIIYKCYRLCYASEGTNIFQPLILSLIANNRQWRICWE